MFERILSKVWTSEVWNMESLVSIVLASSLIFYLYQRHKLSYFSKYGLKTPAPRYLVGNTLELLSKKRPQYEVEWPRKYGKVYGRFWGSSPQVVVADPDILRRICIKDFHLFPNHEGPPFLSKSQSVWLIAMRDDHWHRARAIMSPAFTSGRMKKMFDIMKQCSNELSEILREKSQTKEQEMNCKDVFGLYTMDIITTCAFGVKLKRDKNVSDVKTVASRDTFVAAALASVEPNLLSVFTTLVFPSFLLKLLGYTGVSDSILSDLYSRAESIVEVRRREGEEKHDDFLQLLMDAELTSELDVTENDVKESHHAGMTEKVMRDDHQKMAKSVDKISDKKLTEFEVISNVMFLIVVGYETTGALLANFTYTMAFHPEIQSRLYRELQQLKQQDGSYTYDDLTGAPYLDACISETLRLLPPVLSLDRIPTVDYKIDDLGITIPKGCKIECAYYAIHHDPDYWPDPEKFDPERFMPENRNKIVPGSYCPFGLGPRHCLGMRLSLTESKLAIAQMLDNYEISPAPGTSFPPKSGTSIFLNTYNDLRVRVIERE